MDYSPFEWLSEHIHVLGWPAIVLLTFRLSRFLGNFEARVDGFEAGFTKVMDNDVPHMRESLDSLRESVKDLDAGLWLAAWTAA